MRIVYATSPGRFPTVTYDPGAWWDIVAGTEHTALSAFALNYEWWRVLVGPAFGELALEALPIADRRLKRSAWRANGYDFERRATAAASALDELQRPDTYASLSRYLRTLAPVAIYFETVANIQTEFLIDVDVGPRVRGLDYEDSDTLVRFSASRSLLERTISVALDRGPAAYDLVLLGVTCPEDLLTSLIAARQFRARQPNAHIALIDHAHENFALSASIATLRMRKTLDSVFDTIVASKDERDDVVPALVDAVRGGRAPKGYIRSADLRARRTRRVSGVHPLPPLPTFAPEPILWTRASKRRCYWSRCTFCTQNAKYDRADAPARSEIRANLQRVVAYTEAGYEKIMFSDEAISPSALRVVADEILSRGLKIRWACRSKMERAHNATLFTKLAQSGCFEILFGVESASPRILELMDKVTDGMDDAQARIVFQQLDAAGIAVHVTLIVAFPGETLAEVERTVTFAADALGACRSATFALNHFQLLGDTPIAQNPTTYGLREVQSSGDICAPLRFEIVPELAAESDRRDAAIPGLRGWLDQELGWSRFNQIPGGDLARHLYFYSGHGAIFKSGAENQFANAAPT